MAKKSIDLIQEFLIYLRSIYVQIVLINMH